MLADAFVTTMLHDDLCVVVGDRISARLELKICRFCESAFDTKGSMQWLQVQSREKNLPMFSGAFQRMIESSDLVETTCSMVALETTRSTVELETTRSSEVWGLIPSLLRRVLTRSMIWAWGAQMCSS